MLFYHFFDGVQYHPIGHPSHPDDILRPGEVGASYLLARTCSFILHRVIHIKSMHHIGISLRSAAFIYVRWLERTSER